MNTCNKPLSERTLGEAADCAGQAIRSSLDTFQAVLHSPASATLGDWGTAILMVVAAIPVFLCGAYLLGIVLGVLLVSPIYIGSRLPDRLTSRVKSLASRMSRALKAFEHHTRGLMIPIMMLIFGSIVVIGGIGSRDFVSTLIIGLAIICVAMVIIALALVGRRSNKLARDR